MNGTQPSTSIRGRQWPLQHTALSSVMNRSLTSQSPDEDARGLERTALWSILGFWAFYYAIITVRALIIGFDDQDMLALRRIPIAFIGIGISFAIYRVLRALDRHNFWRRVAVAALLALPASALFSAANYTAFYVLDPIENLDRENEDDKHSSTAAVIADGATYWLFFFYAWSALYLAISYSYEVRGQERRASNFQAQAHGAQIRALRYQINPHFLFNTLNSISALILRDRKDEAEEMVVRLATFFRSSLSTDPLDDVRLADEIALQRLYLEIEKVRFPDRLEVIVDVPPDLESAQVPSLILQPLVENAIKYGVARSASKVTLRISARAEAKRLLLRVEDDGDAGPTGGAGTGVGLANVCQRLAARYGSEQYCRFGPVQPRGFAVELGLPLALQA